MDNELYHVTPRRGYTKPDHKYLRREWRNGRWVYFYEDESKAKEYPKGQNYKTAEQREQERKDAAAAAANEKARSEKKTSDRDDRIKKFADAVDSVIDKGKKALDRISNFLSTPVVDTFRRRGE